MQDGRFSGGQVVGVQYGVSSNGTDQVGVVIEKDKQRVTSILYFSDAAAAYSINKLRACGWKGDDLGLLIKPGTEDPETHIGKPNWMPVPVEFSLTTEKDAEGKEYPQKCNIYDGQGAGMVFKNPMDDGSRRAFGERFKNLTSQGATAPSVAGNTGGVKL